MRINSKIIPFDNLKKKPQIVKEPSFTLNIIYSLMRSGIIWNLYRFYFFANITHQMGNMTRI